MSVSTPAAAPTKRPSRSNSISNSVSSSVMTIKKSASVSSRTGSRPSYLRNRSTSPDSISRVLHSLNSSRSDFRNRPDLIENRKQGAGLNGHRWSHSTSSSLSAIDSDLIRKRTSSIRRSVGTGHASNANNVSSQARNSQDYKLENRASPKRSSSSSNRASPHPGSRLAFQDSSNLKVVQDLSHPTSVNSTTSASTTAWEQTSGLTKFGEPIQSLSIQYTAPAASIFQGSGQPTHSESIHRVEARQPSSVVRHSDTSRTKYRDIANNKRGSATAGPQRTEPPNGTETRSPRRRDMLSRALAKANEAVILDNAQSVNAAIEAYNDACELLQQVMLRSGDLADRRKLSSIKATYSKRIAELHDFDDTFIDLMRPLPEDPPLDDYDHSEDFYQDDSSDQALTTSDAPAVQLPLRQESLLPEIFGGDNYIHDRALPPVPHPLPNTLLNRPMDEQYMPPPLSPRPPLLNQTEDQNVTPTQADSIQGLMQAQPQSAPLVPSSWLDQADEQSSKSSSRLSSLDYDRKDNQLMSAIEAEFDAMNAAVDSAYNDEIDQESTPRNTGSSTNPSNSNRYDHMTGQYLDDDAEHEEQLLDGMTKELELSEAQFGQQTVSALPRKSDSSGFSGRTWGSSVASTTATARTTLTTLAEIIEPPQHAPPMGGLPEPPRSAHKTIDAENSLPIGASTAQDKHVGIRDRRMSGQSAKQLKIETFSRRASITQPTRPLQAIPNIMPVEESSDIPKEVPMRTLAPAASFSSSFSSAQPLTPMLSVHSGDMPMEESPATPALTYGGSTDDGTYMDPSPSRHGKMMPPPPGSIARRAIPTSNLGKGSLSINTGQLDIDSPSTPGSAVFSADSRRSHSAMSAVSTPGATVLTSTGLGGMYLFEDHIGDPRNPRSPDAFANEPNLLEPCPDSFLLRPFWLMRCLHQTLAHPRGGYISTKLFIPRDIWRVRNVKIKGLDDKIAQCDFLTAALQKLAKVDTLDANAVLEELQSFETILDQVRMVLSKKLGSDVGVSGSTSVFKLSPAGDDTTDLVSSKSTNTSSAAKSFASSWRKLRSKSSSTNLSTNTRNEHSQNLTMASLPMTTSSSVVTSRSHSNAHNRYPPPTPSALPQLFAPHSSYISSLARLFDAVQILDSIARQVEDPGLKFSSSTHVGLELSVRNASEFFAFYIIRFVMGDILMLLDKYLKRGGEWVMS